MAYEFFLSYARANDDPYLKVFIEAVSEVIRERRGLPAGAPVGFFDQRELELGENWDQSIVEALQTSRVFLALWSPAYFKSEYCGKEWALFAQRCNAAALASGGPMPPVIKPVIWIPFRTGDVPPALSVGQFTFGDPAALHNTRGFKYLLKQQQEYRTQYTELVEQLAQQIIDAADAHVLPQVDAVPPLKSIPSAFTAPAPRGGAAPRRPPAGPKHVRFVYVAADPNAFGTARTNEAYTEVGAGDWKPFFPENRTRVHAFLQHFVSSEELGFSSDELSFGPSLLDEIETAWERRQIVVLIVDGWSVEWSAQYRDVLQQLDQRLDYHWCVLVPWNESDTDSVARRAEIQDAISRTFDRHANLSPNPMFFRAGIKSPDDLKQALREVLTRLKEEIKKRAQVDMPVPAGPSKSVIVGPSAQG
jgi:FxsC-like protein